MRSTTSKPTTKTTRVKHTVAVLSPRERKGLGKSLPELRRKWKAMGAVPVSPAMKRRLIAAGAWGMPAE